MTETPSYLLDTNVVSTLVRNRDNTITQRIQQIEASSLILVEPVIHEIERGLLHRNALAQLEHFRTVILPQFNIIPVQLVDWRAAAVFWAYARGRGFQLSDIDLLLASMSVRLNAVLLTNDDDFNILPIKWESLKQTFHQVSV